MPTLMATTKQLSFIESLKSERVIDAHAKLMLAPPVDLSRGQASEMIDYLLKAPKRPKDAVLAGEDRFAHLRDIPKSYYALWAEQVHLAGLTDLMRDDQELIFLRVKPWKHGIIYFERLHGSWGGFTRSALTHDQQVTLAAVIRKDPAEAGKRFADYYKVCARCGAELTEDTSRDRGYGPTCWGYMSH